MLYRIFLYRAVTLPGFAPPTGLINAAVRTGERDLWQGAAPLLEGFDASAVRFRIQNALADPTAETGKGYPLVKFPPQPFAQTPYIYVATSSSRAAEVLPCLYTIALENDLVMYDTETDRAFYSGPHLAQTTSWTEAISRCSTGILHSAVPSARRRHCSSPCAGWVHILKPATAIAPLQ